MTGSSSLSAAARLHVVKAEPNPPYVIDLESHHPQPQQTGTGGNARPQAKSKGKGKSKGKSKSKGKGKAKAKGNSVRDGSPVTPTTPAPARELAGSKHRADHWDDLRRAWAGYLSQSEKGGQRGTHHRDPDGGQPSQSQSGSGQGRRGRGAGGGGGGGQKRKATAMNGNTADDVGNEHAAKRRKTRATSHASGQGASKGKSKGKGKGKGKSRDEDEDAEAAQPHPEFWHPDGSVIVQVGKTKFRLHQSTLQKHSAYFAAAFRENEEGGGGGHGGSGARGPNGGRQLPVYCVAETSAEDFASLLTAIEDPMKYADDGPPMPILAGVLRAARALSFGAQRKWAERMLERTWSATLDALTAHPLLHAAEAFAFARTCGLRGVQKRASYELLRTPTFGQTIVEGELPREDLLKLLHAREQLGVVWAEIAGKAPMDFACPRNTQQPERTGGSGGTSGGGGGGGGSCVSANVDRVHARWTELVHSSGLYVQRMIDPLMGLQDLVGISWKDEGFCKKCASARRNAWAQLRGKLWDDLDVWLELNVEKVD